MLEPAGCEDGVEQGEQRERDRPPGIDERGVVRLPLPQIQDRLQDGSDGPPEEQERPPLLHHRAVRPASRPSAAPKSA